MAKMDPGADEKWSGQEKTKNTPSTNDATKGEPARDSNVAPDGAGGSRLPSGEDKGLNPGQRGPAQPTGTGPSGTAP